MPEQQVSACERGIERGEIAHVMRVPFAFQERLLCQESSVLGRDLDEIGSRPL
jgi:hypothetical protein